MLRSQVLSVARKLRDLLLDAPVITGNFENAPTATAWLNVQQRRILTKRGGERRPSYTWGVLQSAHLAAALKIPRISVLEFGVAGGNGLVSLELISADVEQLFGVGIDVYGFDAGSGLPAPLDHRDSPNLFQASAFPMDEQKLRARLTRAQLLLGDVGATVPKFIASNPAPVGFVAFDLDLYSSTAQALHTFEAPAEVLLPRVLLF